MNEHDKCLISSFFIDDILDFLGDELKIKNPRYQLTPNNYQYKIGFSLEESRLEEIKDKLIEFKTGRFRTTSIYRLNTSSLGACNNGREQKWVKVWKRCAKIKKIPVDTVNTVVNGDPDTERT